MHVVRASAGLLVTFLGFSMVGPCFAQPSQDLRLYVSVHGNDAWSGKLHDPNDARTDGPFATLQHARDEIRRQRRANNLPGATVSVRGGTYALSQAFTLGKEDSGSAEAPIVYRAFEGESPILTGAKPITGFVPYKGGILKTDVAKQGFKGIYFRQIFFNGERQHLARCPNLDPKRPYCGGWLYAGGKSSEIYKDSPQKRLLAFKDGDVPRYVAPNLGEVDIYPYYNWSNCIIPVASIDYEKQIITLAKDAHRGVRPGNRYYLRNFFEDLDAPGEWFLDKKTWTLYFWPPGPIENAVVAAPQLDTLVDVKGAAHVAFQGFTLECCDGTAIQVNDGTNCLIAGNTIRRVGGRLHTCAIEINNGTKNGAVGNDICDTAGHGIAINGGDMKKLLPAENYAENNYVHHIGYLDGHGVGLRIGGVGNRLSHNLIHDTARCGIFGGGKLHVIEYNRIRHTNLRTCDTGAIYICGATTGWVPSGLVIRHNFITDTLGFGPVKQKDREIWVSPHYAWGIYLDDGFSGAHVFGNVVARTPYDGIFIHGGRENVIENNVIVNCDSGQMIYSAWMPPPELKPSVEKWFKECQANPAYKRFSGLPALDVSVVGMMADNKFLRNVVYYSEPGSRLYRQRKLVLEKTESDYNLIHHFGLPLLVDLPNAPPDEQWNEWRKLGFDRHSIIVNPMFVDQKTDDYQLRPESSAFKLGFKAIPMEKIGPYKDPLRATWPIHEADGVRERPLVCERPARPKPEPKSNPRNTTPFPAGRAVKPIVLDGALSPGEWSEPKMVLKETSQRIPIPGTPCYAQACWDDKRLYVALTVPLNDASKLVRDDAWGKGDCAEVCFQDLSGKPPGTIFVLHGFPSGFHESVSLGGAPADEAAKVGKAMRFAAKVGDKQWTSEWAIPLDAAGIAPRPGLKLAFNMAVHRTETSNWICWVGALGSAYQLDKAGYVVLE